MISLIFDCELGVTGSCLCMHVDEQMTFDVIAYTITKTSCSVVYSVDLSLARLA